MYDKLLTKKITQSVLDVIDKYIDYYQKGKGRLPDRVLITENQYTILRNEAKTNEDFRNELSQGEWRGVSLERHEG